MDTPRQPPRPRRPTTRRASSNDRLQELARAVSEDRAVDWDAESSDAPHLRSAIRRLQQLQSVARAHREIAASERGDSDLDSPAVLFEWGPLQALESVGHGSFGDVYRALDTRLRREVALKLRRTELAESEPSARRFLDEARRLARVRHPNVLVIYGADIHDRRAGFWTDFIRGETLAARLAEGGPLEAGEATRIGVSLCRALAAVHAAELLHGDVKAANVMREDGGRIVLMDFGAASMRPGPADSPAGPPSAGAAGLDAPLGPSSTTPTTLFGSPSFGTPLVIAPELLRGQAAEPTSDLYSLGVLLYHLTTGRYPIEAESLLELQQKHERGERIPLLDRRTDLPLEFTRVVDRALSSDPAERYQDAAEMERALLTCGVLRADVQPPFSDHRDEGQTLRSLLDEIGPLPEEMCRRIGREAARALARIHDAGRSHGELSTSGTLVLRSGGVQFRPPTTDRDLEAGAATPRETSVPTRGQRADFHKLGELLHEAATGRRFESPEGCPQSPEDLRGLVSRFFEKVIHWLLEDQAPEGVASARDVLRVLTDGERSAWWRDRRRAIRHSSRPSLRRMRISRETGLHGRDAQVRGLRAIFERVKSGDGQVVLLEGEAGIGKTRLVDEMVRKLEEEGEEVNFLFGSYPPGGAATATSAFLTAYRDHLGEETLEEALQDYLVAAPLLIAPFAALLKGESRIQGSGLLGKGSLDTAFVHVTQALAEERPTIVLIDDLHFAPEEGRGLFAALAHASPGHRFLLVGCTRPGISEEWTAAIVRQEQSTSFVLDRLGPDVLGHILKEAVGSAHLAEELLPALAARCDGNPLFLFETLRALEESELVSRDTGGAWNVEGRIEVLPTPPSVLHLIHARLSGLEEKDRSLLEVACCDGFEFDPTLVAEATGRKMLPALKRFALLERRHRLIHAVARRYVFDHHQVQEALYAGLSEPLREHYHTALARALESREGASERDPKQLDGALAVRIAEHSLRGRSGRAGLRYLDAALDHLEGIYQNEAVVQLAELALAPHDLLTGRARFDVLARKTRRLATLGRLAAEHAALAELVGLSRAIDDPHATCQALHLLGHRYVRDSRNDEARAVLDEGLQLARACGDPVEESVMLSALGNLHYGMGRYGQALEMYTAGHELAHRTGDRAREVAANGNMGGALFALGRPAEGRGYFARSLAIAREIGDALGEAMAVGHLAVVLNSLGESQAAVDQYEQHRLLARKLGYRQGEAIATFNLGSALADKFGQTAVALAHLDRALRLFREVGYRLGEGVAIESIGTFFVILGDYEAARPRLEESLARSRQIENRKKEADVLFKLAFLDKEVCNYAAATLGYQETLAIRKQLGDREGEASALLALSNVRRRMGLTEEAEALLLQARTLADELQMLPVLVGATIRMAVSDGSGVERALQLFESHSARLGYLERMEAHFLLWRATSKRPHLDEAARMLDEFRAHAPAAYQDSIFRQVRLYREIRAAVDAL